MNEIIFRECRERGWFENSSKEQYRILFLMFNENLSLELIANYISAHNENISSDEVYEIIARSLSKAR